MSKQIGYARVSTTHQATDLGNKVIPRLMMQLKRDLQNNLKMRLHLLV